MKSTKCTSIDQLKKLTTNHVQDFAIQLNGGAYSRKEISYYPKDNVFSIFHSIDGTMEELTPEQLLTETNIGKAIEQNAFSLITY